MAHGDAREGKWRGNWRMEWVASTLTLPRNMVYPSLLSLMRTPRLPVVEWTDAPADLNGLVRFAERRNLVSTRVPSHFKRSLPVLLRIWYDAFCACADVSGRPKASAQPVNSVAVWWVLCVWAEHATSIFMVQATVLNLEAVCSSKTGGIAYQTTRYHKHEETLFFRCC